MMDLRILMEHSELNLESQEHLALKQGKAVLRFSVT